VSAISVAGIALASLALICTLSVFNGFQDLVAQLFTDFDPELKIVPVKGKVFDPESESLLRVRQLSYVDVVSQTIEEQALIRYKNRQEIVMVKGVSDNFHELSAIENTLVGQGIYMLHDDVSEYGILGVGLAHRLDCGVQSVLPFNLYVPRSGVRINMANPSQSLSNATFFSPGVLFQVNQSKYDDNYVLVSLDIARSLFGLEGKVSALELSLTDDIGVNRAKKEIISMIGPDYKVLDRYEQQEDVFRIVRLEKFVSYLFLSFILLIACFNIVGSLIMFIVQKRQDSVILVNLGLSPHDVGRVFVCYGSMVSMAGAISGLVAGVALVLLQKWLGFIPLGSGDFVVDAYPVSLHLTDAFLVLITVLAVSFISVRPVGRIASHYIKE